MFGSLGIQEILVILVLALLVFGPKRLPEIGKQLGKALADFRRASTDIKTTVENEIRKIGEEPRSIGSGGDKPDDRAA